MEGSRIICHAVPLLTYNIILMTFLTATVSASANNDPSITLLYASGYAQTLDRSELEDFTVLRDPLIKKV